MADDGRRATTAEPSTASGSSEAVASTQSAARRRRVRRILLIAVALVVLAVLVGVPYYLHARHFESTDDAFIEAHVIPVSSRVGGFVTRVHVDDNMHVEAGALLVELDSRDFDARLAQARANLAAAQTDANRARTDASRYETLARKEAVSVQARDNAIAEARTTGAKVAQLQAAVDQAELDRSYTKIYAPSAGRITRKSVEPGSYVQVGQTLFSIVPESVWVIANFKETQLRYMRPGQPVTVTVDAYPGHRFSGHVDSIQAGAGARFSLLPPENATGNYVKVVQRVPVKIVLDDPVDPAHRLAPGMSVVPHVTVR